jgi:hypothetical protein
LCQRELGCIRFPAFLASRANSTTLRHHLRRPHRRCSGNAWFYGDQRSGRPSATAAWRIERCVIQTQDRREGYDRRASFIDIRQSRGALLNGDGRLISKPPRASPPKSWAKGDQRASNDQTLAADSDETSRKINARFSGPHGFRDYKAVQQHGGSPNLDRCRRDHLRMYGKGMAQGGPSPANRANDRLMKEPGRRAFGLASALIPAGELPPRRADRARAPNALRRRLSRICDRSRSRFQPSTAIEIGRKGGVPVDLSKAAGQADSRR